MQNIKTFNIKDVREWYDEQFSERGVYANSRKLNKRLLKLVSLSSSRRASFLDVGCGGGFLLREAEKFCKTYGVDLSLVAIKQACDNSPRSKFFCSKAESLPFRGKIFDFLSCIGSLEHFIEPEKVLKEFGRVTKKDGKILILVPNRYDLLTIIEIIFKGKATDKQIIQRVGTCEEWKGIISKFMKVKSIQKINREVDIALIREGLRARNRGNELFVWFLFIILRFIEMITPKNLCWSFVYICQPY